MIVTDLSLLRKVSIPARSAGHGLKIAARLRAEMDRSDRSSLLRAAGLAAPQIGVFRRVCVLRLGHDLVLVNPVIAAHSEAKAPAQEKCLSFPGERVDTFRYVWVEVRADNLPGPLTFGPRHDRPAGGGELSLSPFGHAVLAQHEIAHLSGLIHRDFAREDYPGPSEWDSWEGP